MKVYVVIESTQYEGDFVYCVCDTEELAKFKAEAHKFLADSILVGSNFRVQEFELEMELDK